MKFKPYSSTLLAFEGFLLMALLLTTYISITSLRKRTRGGFAILAVAGMTSIGSMTVINFIIGSDFKWLLFVFMLPWAIGLILYLLNK